MAVAAALLVLGAASPFEPGHAQSGGDDANCAAGMMHVPLTFPGGAAWELCAAVDTGVGLRVEAVHYRAPGDAMRSVLGELHVASVRVHAHDSAAPIVLPSSGRDSGTAQDCPAGTRSLADDAALCVSTRSVGLLFRYGDISGGQAGRHDLDAWQRLPDGNLLRTRISFGETGTLMPSVTLYGRAADLKPLDSSATATWRAAFALDSPSPDRVEEFDFELLQRRGSRRVMKVTPLNVEGARAVQHDRFTGWRVLDRTGAGYYLDSQRATSSWRAGPGTRTEEPERFTLTAGRRGERDPQRLNDYLDGERMGGRDPVVWYTATALSVATPEGDGGASATAGFTLIPFDWTRQSPFAPAAGS